MKGAFYTLLSPFRGTNPFCGYLCFVNIQTITPIDHNIIMFVSLGQDAGRDWVAQDDEMMQLALDQYLLDDREAADQVTLWEALQTQQDPELQR